MEEELISKKEILELTGISYGQLYRWKRKNLIPEDWFIRKSTYTGQETFFPKDKILDRIDKIINMKDDLSLDDIATMFSPQLADIFLSKEELLEKKIVSELALTIYDQCFGETKTFSFEKILYISILENCLKSGDVSFEEGKLLLKNLEANYKFINDKNSDIVLIRKFGIASSMLITVPCDVYVDESSKMVLRTNISKCIEELKLKI